MLRHHVGSDARHNFRFITTKEAPDAVAKQPRTPPVFREISCSFVDRIAPGSTKTIFAGSPRGQPAWGARKLHEISRKNTQRVE